MQDLHAIAGGTMFGATAAVDRRLRPFGHHSAHQALKCPRCDSLNTKFCYYNNYNLSQPRHFCKSCRRYWTKGGVLRNVPVGGGCRKNKRSKIKTSSAEAPAGAEDEIPIAMQQQTIDRKSSSHSSSESSSLTAATTEAVSAPTSAASPAALLNILEYNSLAVAGDPNTAGTCFGRSLLAQGPESVGFADIGGLTGTGLITASSSEPIHGGFTFGGALLSQQSQETCHENQWQQQDQIPGAGTGAFLDQTVQVDLSALQSRFGPFDWQPNKDPMVFDLPPNTVDQTYWSQSQIQWTDQDQPGLYLP